MQTAEGSRIERERGTPQGGVISPLLANLFFHYAFDTWMQRNHPNSSATLTMRSAIAEVRSKQRRYGMPLRSGSWNAG